MKVLQVHNRYRQRGGEDAVLENTVAALGRHGVQVATYERSSDSLGDGVGAKAAAVFGSVWSNASHREMLRVLKREQPDVVHVHNLYPLISPSVLDACREMEIPRVMTVHNYRLTCPIGVHFRKGAVCERCRGGFEYWCLLRNCRDNRVESAAYALRNWLVREWDLYAPQVEMFVCISEFLRTFLVRSGLPAGKCVVVPNMIRIPERTGNPAQGRYIGFLGRFVPEKGVEVLVEAARMIPEVPVRIAGTGPLEATLRRLAPSNVEFLGMLSAAELEEFYCGARCTVVPSVWNETFGLVAAEAMAYGVPAIVSDIGGLSEIVLDDVNGGKFQAGDAAGLAAQMRRLWEDPGLAASMGAQAREHVVREYNETRYVERLLHVYNTVAGTPAQAA